MTRYASLPFKNRAMLCDVWRDVVEQLLLVRGEQRLAPASQKLRIDHVSDSAPSILSIALAMSS